MGLNQRYLRQIFTKIFRRDAPFTLYSISFYTREKGVMGAVTNVIS